MDWPGLLDRHGDALALFARQWCRSPSDAEDAVQEGLVRVWRYWKKADGDPVPYLFRSVKHAAIDLGRRLGRRQRWEQKAVMLADNTPPVPLFDEEMGSVDRRLTVEKALAVLPDEQREVLVMKIWGELTFEQIAACMEASPNTIASRYRYALASLRRRLARTGEDPV